MVKETFRLHFFTDKVVSWRASYSNGLQTGRRIQASCGKLVKSIRLYIQPTKLCLKQNGTREEMTKIVLFSKENK